MNRYIVGSIWIRPVDSTTIRIVEILDNKFRVAVLFGEICSEFLNEGLLTAFWIEGYS